VKPSRRELRQGLQHEAALMHARVRHREPRRLNFGPAVQQDVDVDGPRALGDTALAAQFTLDALDPGEQHPRKEVGLDLDHQVEEPGLLLEIQRLGLVDG